ncbi:MAG: hypothetical protein M0033_09785 [Nitrospiraceae bacterium]|nr:hypothetical protein [Nitrospiraceae bacterium]MDA8326493.1 hypothetical protein [Nitrospiraceae bacterium]
MALCFGCRHFVNNPRLIESSIPGLNALSSAFASVRGEAGLCSRLNLFLSPTTKCSYFESDESVTEKRPAV